MMLITHLHPVPKLRMTGVVPLLPMYAFMVWMGIAVLFLTLHLGISNLFIKYLICLD